MTEAADCVDGGKTTAKDIESDKMNDKCQNVEEPQLSDVASASGIEASARPTVVSRKAPVEINDLPDEILLKIFLYLSTGDLGWSSRVCRRWCDLVSGRKSLWKSEPWVITSTGDPEQLLAVAKAIPPLEAVYLLFGGIFGMHIGWPVAKVFYAADFVTLDPYIEVFGAESLVMDSLTVQYSSSCLLPVKLETVVRITVVEPLCEPGSFRNKLASTYDERSRNNPRRRRATLSQIPSNGERLLESQNENNSVSSLTLLQQTNSSRNASCIDRVEIGAQESLGDELSVCPALRTVRVLCESLPYRVLENLCHLGPMHSLCIECRRLTSLSFLRVCSSGLEELTVADCSCLPEDAFEDLHCLKNLRSLHLSNCRIAKSVLEKYVEDLPYLQSFEVQYKLCCSPISETSAVFLLSSLLRRQPRRMWNSDVM